MSSDAATPAFPTVTRAAVFIGARPWLSALVLALAVVALRWPGTLIGDNDRQLAEIRAGQLTDWHPPLFSIIWQALGLVPQSILLFNNCLYWTGIALLADQLRRSRGSAWAGILVLAGLTPLSIYYLGVVQKDTTMAAFFLLAAGLAARFGYRAGLVPATLGALTRVNGVFAAPVLLLEGRFNKVTTIAIGVAVSVAAIPVASLVNHRLLGASRSHVEKSLQLFDIVGTEKGRFVECYSPFYWDTLQLHCRAFDRTRDDLSTAWLRAIAAHPLAYAGHRLDYYNHALYFLVPFRQECVLVPRDEPGCINPAPYPLLRDIVSKNFFFWPVLWLAIGIAMLFAPLERVARNLVISGLLYGLAYLFVGVATGFRYFYWSEIAIQFAFVWQLGFDRSYVRPTAIAAAAVFCVGYGARILYLLA